MVFALESVLGIDHIRVPHLQYCSFSELQTNTGSKYEACSGVLATKRFKVVPGLSYVNDQGRGM